MALGITMINEYCSMVREDFAPIINLLQSRTLGVKDKIEVQVKIDFGVYDLYKRKAELEVMLGEVKSKLNRWEVNDWRDGKSGTKISREVERRLDLLNTPLREVLEQRDKLIRQIKMSGIGEDIKGVFDSIPEILKELNDKFKNLKPITEKELKKLSSGEAEVD